MTAVRDEMMGKEGTPMTRKEAREAGLGQYPARKDCAVPGHGNMRYVGNDCCVKCERERVRVWKKERPEKVREYDKKYRKSRPGYDAERCKNYRSIVNGNDEFLVNVREAGLND